MAKVVGDIAVQVGADVSDLLSAMRKGAKSVRSFDATSSKMAANFTKVGFAVTAATGLIVAGVSRIAVSAGQMAAEITNLSAVAGVGVERFQQLSIAAESVGIQQEKLADIFKDVNDKFGDFMATGAGPLADFFDNIAPKVGVTAEQFAKLSGPEALQLYVTSLEKAGVSQQQMTFYMEALASDATALIPLLRDNGGEMRRLGDEAQRTGRVLSSETVAGAKALDDKFRALKDQIRDQLITSLIGLEDELDVLAAFVYDTAIPALEALISAAARVAAAYNTVRDAIQSLGGNPQFFDDQGNEYDQNNNIISSPNMDIGSPLIPSSDLLPPSPLPESPPSSVPLVNRSSGGGGGGGGGGGDSGNDALESELEALRLKYATEQELLDINLQTTLEKLAEFREAKKISEDEANSLELEAKKGHEDAMSKLERDAQQARLQSVSGALGDLASLMQSGNDKLHKIGKAAAIADAVVSGYGAAVSAWEKGMKIGGPPVAAAFTAASLAKTASLISGIQSSSSSGGSQAATASGGDVATPTREVQVAEFRFLGDTVSTASLIEAINQAEEQGYTIRGSLA